MGNFTKRPRGSEIPSQKKRNFLALIDNVRRKFEERKCKFKGIEWRVKIFLLCVYFHICNLFQQMNIFEISIRQHKILIWYIYIYIYIYIALLQHPILLSFLFLLQLQKKKKVHYFSETKYLYFFNRYFKAISLQHCSADRILRFCCKVWKSKLKNNYKK